MELVLLTILSIGDPLGIEISWVVHELSFGINTTWELERYWNGIIDCLFPIAGFPVS
jgi:hypothetical protein